MGGMDNSILYLHVLSYPYREINDCQYLYFSEKGERDKFRVLAEKITGLGTIKPFEVQENKFKYRLYLKDEDLWKIEDAVKKMDIKPELGDFFDKFQSRMLLEFDEEQTFKAYFIAIKNEGFISEFAEMLMDKGITVHNNGLLTMMNHDRSGVQADISLFHGGAEFRLTEQAFNHAFAKILNDKKL